MPDWRISLINLATDISEENELTAKNGDKAAELKSPYDKWNAEQTQPLWSPGSKDDPSGIEAKQKAVVGQFDSTDFRNLEDFGSLGLD